MDHNPEPQAVTPPMQARGLFMVELVHAHQALVAVFSREVGLSPSRLRFMHEFMHCGSEGLGLTDLALRLGVTPALVTRQVKELEAQGMAERISDPRDGRRASVRLTPAGLAMLERLQERAHRFSEALLADMDPEQLAQAGQALAELRRLLDAQRLSGRPLLDAGPALQE